jgi:hypothetical protein
LLLKFKMTRSVNLKRKSKNFKVKIKVMLPLTVIRPVCLGVKHPSGAYDQIFVTVIQLRVCCCGAPSLTTRRVCRLQLLLTPLALSLLGPSPTGPMTKFYCLRFETPPTSRVRFPYLYPLGTVWPSYTPDTGLHFRRLLQLPR